MGKNLAQKILDSHIVDGAAKSGNEVGIRIDQTLTQDATGTMAYLQFEALGFKRVKTQLSVSYVDHNTIQDGFENADDHKYLETVAREYGIKYSKPGNGICHQVHLERFAVPGKTLLGSDSHTPTAGGIGMLAIGAGGLDVAVAMGGGPFYLTYPKVIKIELVGELRPWVAAKDVVLKVLEILSTNGNVGYVVEYGGEGIKTLSVPQRATITNMGAELGVTTSIFPSDSITKSFLTAQGRGESFASFKADKDAEYDRVITIDLSDLVPLAACPHSPGNIKPLKELKGTRVDQVCIGSCTNASYRDIMLVASVLKGRKVHPDVSLGVSCGSRQVLEMVSRNGALADIVASGARILESVCGFCIGNSMAPKSDAVSVRTSNRNFYARTGTATAQVFLVSPEAAVAAALAGELVDPRDFFTDFEFPDIASPRRYNIDDSMVCDPGKSSGKVLIFRGPNIGEPPSNGPYPEILDGPATIKVGDMITTDHIMPAGKRLKYRSNIGKYAEYVFETNDPGFAQRALANKKNGLNNIIIAGESYGQGSSREHAAICPMYLGVKLVAAKSIERIHRANLINFGIVPAVFEDPSDWETINQGDRLKMEGIRKAIDRGGPLDIINITKGKRIRLLIDCTDRERKILLAGGMINAVKNNMKG